jgi:hypothetical protein
MFSSATAAAIGPWPRNWPTKYDVFISYSSRDRAMAEELANRLREAGLSLFFDRWCLPGGKPWGPLLLGGRHG